MTTGGDWKELVNAASNGNNKIVQYFGFGFFIQASQ